jgi:CheY-like chemotaxis protein
MSKTILCVDDSATMQTVCEITFRASDYTYVGARNADEGLQKARDARPALVLVDAVMPGKTGYDLCEALKQELSDVPVLIMCGNSQAYDEGRGNAAGADGHVTKPWDSTKLIEQLDGILSRAASEGVVSPRSAASAPAPTPPAPAPTPAPPRPAPVAAAPPQSLPQPPAGLERPPMIRGVPTKRPATPIPPPGRVPQPAAGRVPQPAAGRVAQRVAANPSAPRSATIMGMSPVTQVPAKATPKPPGVTSISSKRPIVAQPGVAPPGVAQPGVAPPGVAQPGVAQPPVEMVAERVQAAVPAAAEAAARSAGLDPSGPEMAALVKLSREVIERVVWEVVPELAETIIRENLDRLAKQ